MTLKKAISEKRRHIDFIKESGLQKKSKSITSFTGNNPLEAKPEDEKVEEQIATLENTIRITKQYLEVIETALSEISDHKYYDIIRMRYFDGVAMDKIAEHFEVDVKTVSRNKNQLVGKLAIYMFSDEVITEIFK